MEQATKVGKDEKRCDPITISGILLLALAILVMYRTDRPSGQTGGQTRAIKEAAAQTDACVDRARRRCDERASARPVTLVSGEKTAEIVRRSVAKVK